MTHTVLHPLFCSLSLKSSPQQTGGCPDHCPLQCPCEFTQAKLYSVTKLPLVPHGSKEGLACCGWRDSAVLKHGSTLKGRRSPSYQSFLYNVTSLRLLMRQEYWRESHFRGRHYLPSDWIVLQARSSKRHLNWENAWVLNRMFFRGLEDTNGEISGEDGCLDWEVANGLKGYFRSLSLTKLQKKFS